MRRMVSCHPAHFLWFSRSILKGARQGSLCHTWSMGDLRCRWRASFHHDRLSPLSLRTDLMSRGAAADRTSAALAAMHLRGGFQGVGLSTLWAARPVLHGRAVVRLGGGPALVHVQPEDGGQYQSAPGPAQRAEEFVPEQPDPDGAEDGLQITEHGRADQPQPLEGLGVA